MKNQHWRLIGAMIAVTALAMATANSFANAPNPTANVNQNNAPVFVSANNDGNALNLYDISAPAFVGGNNNVAPMNFVANVNNRPITNATWLGVNNMVPTANSASRTGPNAANIANNWIVPALTANNAKEVPSRAELTGGLANTV